MKRDLHLKHVEYVNDKFFDSYLIDIALDILRC